MVLKKVTSADSPNESNDKNSSSAGLAAVRVGGAFTDGNELKQAQQNSRSGILGNLTRSVREVVNRASTSLTQAKAGSELDLLKPYVPLGVVVRPDPASKALFDGSGCPAVDPASYDASLVDVPPEVLAAARARAPSTLPSKGPLYGHDGRPLTALEAARARELQSRAHRTSPHECGMPSPMAIAAEARAQKFYTNADGEVMYTTRGRVLYSESPWASLRMAHAVHQSGADRGSEASAHDPGMDDLRHTDVRCTVEKTFENG